jgi:phage baseplate assembly protein gpV
VDDDKGADSGSAYVFTRATAGDLTSGWTQVAKLTAGDGAGA